MMTAPCSPGALRGMGQIHRNVIPLYQMIRRIQSAMENKGAV